MPKMVRILHADDDQSNREGIKYALEDVTGCELTSVESVYAANQLMDSQKFDLVIMDGTLDPERAHDGVWFAGYLRRHGQRVVVLSGDEYARKESATVGVEFLSKEIDSMDRIRAIIEEIRSENPA